MILIHERLDPNHDACNTLDVRRHGQGHQREEAGRGYHPYHDRRYNNGEDQSPSIDPWGPRAFG
jgi:hypothetical protein